MKKILIIDDKPEQLEIARKAAFELGLDPVVVNAREMVQFDMTYRWMTLIPTVDLIATDLMWEVSEGHGEKMNGLLVTILAKHFDKPVGICTNGSDHDRGHHGPAISFINDSFIGCLEEAMWVISGENELKVGELKKHPPFVWNTRKDWKTVMEKLLEQVTS